MKKRICWVTASYFLDVDLPIVPKLMNQFSIDWKIITSSKSIESDENYIKSQTGKSYELVLCKGKFYTPRLYAFFKSFVINIKNQNYDWIYFDISDYFFLYPLVKRYLGDRNVTIAIHNVSIPKGARLPLFAKWSVSYITKHFKHFQVFSRNQMRILQKKAETSEIFYCPLMLKDYGKREERQASDKTRFLFFGNIIQYKRLDILLNAVNLLIEQGVNNFTVDICGYCRSDIWNSKYAPLVKHPDIVHCDIRRIPNELVSSYFNHNDYFVMPYQDIAQSGAMTVALNYNMPIIASDLDTFREFITHKENGYLFPQGSINDLADAIKWAINNNGEEYSRLKINLQKMVDSNLSESIILTRYTEYLKSCLNA